MSDSLQPHGLQHARLACPSLSPGVCSLMSIESVMPSNHLSLCGLASPPAPSLSQHQGLSQWAGSSHQAATDWGVTLSISPSEAHSGLISWWSVKWYSYFEKLFADS